MMVSSAKVAVIGCGRWGVNLIRVLSEIECLAAVCDINRESAENASKSFNVPVLQIDEICQHSNIDAVAIAVPSNQHATIARQFLEADKHVFVEKPLTLNTHDARALVQLSQERKKVLMVGHLLHYHSGYIELKKLALNGNIGKIRFMYSKRLKLGKIGSEENVLWNLAPHDISMILGITGELPEWVNAHGNAIMSEKTEDAVTFDMMFKSGIRAQVHVSGVYPSKENYFLIVGESGMLIFDDIQPWEKKIQLHSYNIETVDGVAMNSTADVLYPRIDFLEPLQQELLHYIECFKNNLTPRTDGFEGTYVVQILEAVQKSMKECKPCEVNPKDLSYYVHETAIIDEGCKIGNNTKIWHFSHLLKGTIVGNDCTIGQNVMIGPDVKIGDQCKIQNNVSLYKGLTLERGVFCGPSCVFTNDYNPRAEIDRKDEFRSTYIEEGASIGANATIVCGVRLGSYSFIGAGCVIIRDVRPHTLMVGNPGRQIGWISHAGEKLGPDLICPREGRRYCITVDGGLEEILDNIRSSNLQTEIRKSIPFIDLKAQQRRIRSQIDVAIKRVLDHGYYIMGPEVYQLEHLLAEFCGAKHCISCSNGTDALTLALKAKKVGPGHAVLVPSFTFAATAEAVALAGATIVFIDSYPDTFNIDCKSLELGIQTAQQHGLLPIGIISVDLFGQPADYNAIRVIADKYQLWIMCDGAQSFGASYDDRRVGNIADLTTTSFFPAKPLGCYGDGGAVFTNDDELASIIKSLRIHGQGASKYDNIQIGINGRLDTIQAAILIEKLKLLPTELEARQKVAQLYNTLLKGFVQLPHVLPQILSSWAQYTIVLPQHVNRDKLMEDLKNKGIPTMIYYKKPMHMQQAYNSYLTAGDISLPVCEELASRVLSLPMSGYINDCNIHRVCDALIHHIKQ